MDAVALLIIAINRSSDSETAEADKLIIEGNNIGRALSDNNTTLLVVVVVVVTLPLK